MGEKLRHAGVRGGAGADGRERELADLATRQHGVVARDQLLAIGLSENTVDRWLAKGRLRRIHSEAYAVGHERLSQRGRWLAAVLAYREGALLSHLSAASLWGLAKDRGPVDVTAPIGRQGLRRRPRIRLHRSKIHPEDRAERGEIPVTSLARTLFDVSEAVDYERLKRMREESDRLGLLQIRELEQVCGRGCGRHALRPVRRLLAELAAPTETRSPLEERFAAFRQKHRLPTPAANVLVLDDEVDVLWPAARLIVELDSREYHGHDDAFERDRLRDARHLVAGYRTVRITHRRLNREPKQLASELRRLLAQDQNPSPAPAPMPAT
jgi:predicted transcriptional regulator of viral defense system